MLSNLWLFFSWTLWCHEVKVVLHKWDTAQGKKKGRAETSLAGATVRVMGRIFLIHSHDLLGSFLLPLEAHLTEGMLEKQDFLF